MIDPNRAFWAVLAAAFAAAVSLSVDADDEEEARPQRTARAGPSNVANKPSPTVSISPPR
jgi:hypothetical protein